VIAQLSWHTAGQARAAFGRILVDRDVDRSPHSPPDSLQLHLDTSVAYRSGRSSQQEVLASGRSKLGLMKQMRRGLDLSSEIRFSDS
jgi:hypothetical protein